MSSISKVAAEEIAAIRLEHAAAVEAAVEVVPQHCTPRTKSSSHYNHWTATGCFIGPSHHHEIEAQVAKPFAAVAEAADQVA